MTLIFCFTRIFRNSHRQIFGLDKLLQEGYSIVLLDMGGMFGKDLTCRDELMLKLQRKCSTKDELIAFRKELDSDPVIYICNDTYLGPAYDAFKILVRKQDRLLAFRIKASPFQHQPDKGLKLLIKKISEKVEGVPLHVLKPFYKSFYNYYIPDYFLCSTRYYLPAKALMTVRKENIIIAHSDDVNEIIEDTSPVQTGEKIGVFLDQVLPFAYRGEVNEKLYYEQVDRTLKSLKKQFNLDKIVIAKHPAGADFAEDIEKRYAGYESYIGKTQKLIKNSTYVFAHYSTSIGIAVFYEKPVVLLIDDNLRQVAWISQAIKTYKNMLGLPLVEMGQKEYPQLNGYSIDKRLYYDYIEKYMRDSALNVRSYHYAIKKIEKDLI